MLNFEKLSKYRYVKYNLLIWYRSWFPRRSDVEGLRRSSNYGGLAGISSSKSITRYLNFISRKVKGSSLNVQKLTASRNYSTEPIKSRVTDCKKVRICPTLVEANGANHFRRFSACTKSTKALLFFFDGHELGANCNGIFSVCYYHLLGWALVEIIVVDRAD